MSIRQAQLQTNLTHFVFGTALQRFNQAHLHLFRQATHVGVRFDDVRFTAAEVCGRFDNVRADGACASHYRVFSFSASSSNTLQRKRDR